MSDMNDIENHQPKKRSKNGTSVQKRVDKSELFNETCFNELRELLDNTYKAFPHGSKVRNIVEFVLSRLNSEPSTKKKRKKPSGEETEVLDLREFNFTLGVFFGRLIQAYPEYQSSEGCGADWLIEKVINKKRYKPNSIKLSNPSIPSFGNQSDNSINQLAANTVDQPTTSRCQSNSDLVSALNDHV